MNGGQEQVMGGGGPGARLRPELLEQFEDTGLLSGQPEGTGQAEIAHSGSQRYGSRAIANQGGDLFGGAEIALMDDAGVAVDAGTLDHVVVQLVALLLCDEAGHNRVIQVYGNSSAGSIGKPKKMLKTDLK
jgi:hypothetical protein